MGLEASYQSLLDKLAEGGLVRQSITKSDKGGNPTESSLDLTSKGVAQLHALKSILEERVNDLTLTELETACLTILLLKLPPLSPLPEGAAKSRF